MSGCADCRDEFEHCHGTFVLDEDGSAECTTGPSCALDADAHALRLAADPAGRPTAP